MADRHNACCPVEGDEQVKIMTERRMRELAAEARERHKDDPVFMNSIRRTTGQTGGAGQAAPKIRTPSEAFWYWWNSWINKKASMHAEHSLAYKGRNDPTANTAIGIVMKEMDKELDGSVDGSGSERAEQPEKQPERTGGDR